MSFASKIKEHSNRVVSLKSSISTEEATKASMVMPFFQILGYDVFNPKEFCPEFNADVGVKKGEKVDYAIMGNDSEILMLVECKSCNSTLEGKHVSQLYRYFGATRAKFAVLTNGIIYRFYSDLNEVNKMDLEPFFEVNMESLSKNDINHIEKFCKETFNAGEVFDFAKEEKYGSVIRLTLRKN